MYDTILVPTDGSEHAVRAAEHSLALAEAFDATIHVINVVDVQSVAGLFDAGGVDSSFVTRIKAEGEHAIQAIETAVGECEQIQTAVLEGDPSTTLLNYATEHDIDLIAMGTHGRTGFERYITGSVTERVVRQANTPVLTVRATEQNREKSYDDILIPTDGSEFAAAAIEHGVAIANQFDGRIHAVNVLNVGDMSVNPSYTPATELVERLKEDGKKATEQIETRARDAGCEVVTSVREGYPANELLGYTEEHDIDLIAMGTTGRTGLTRFLMGSTTERLIRHADVGVLAVNAREE